jgi:hypothetical protein
VGDHPHLEGEREGRQHPDEPVATRDGDLADADPEAGPHRRELREVRGASTRRRTAGWASPGARAAPDSNPSRITARKVPSSSQGTSVPGASLIIK